jgi:bis(5'-nucleosyl)-tetraphosphatase (symmetrical)
LKHLLETIDFSPSRDHLFALGDLINRGPDSLGTLELLQSLGASATCLLGNHDWHFLATAAGVRPPHRHDTLSPILRSHDRDKHLEWLTQQRMAVVARGWLMVHAGVVPQWDTTTTLQLAAELESVLKGPDLGAFLQVMYSNEPDLWSPTLAGVDRLRFALNVLTRVRFVTPDGRLELKSKEGADKPPEGCLPWFDAPGRQTQDQNIAFGHWSTLGLLNRPHLLGIDTGCIWGGQLTAVRLSDNAREFIQVPCPQAQAPG